jgi:hypothetical protein
MVAKEGGKFPKMRTGFLRDLCRVTETGESKKFKDYPVQVRGLLMSGIPEKLSGPGFTAKQIENEYTTNYFFEC